MEPRDAPKAAIARLLMHRPGLIFLDEPTPGLDPVAAVALRDDLRNLVAESGVTIFLTTHNLDEAEKPCAQVAVLRTGKLLVALQLLFVHGFMIHHPEIGHLRPLVGVQPVLVCGRDQCDRHHFILRQDPFGVNRQMGDRFRFQMEHHSAHPADSFAIHGKDVSLLDKLRLGLSLHNKTKQSGERCFSERSISEQL